MSSRLVPCPRCNRNNGAARTTCIYCGAALPVTKESAAVQVPTLRPVEEWERGYSVVLAPLDQGRPEPRHVERLCAATRLEPEAAEAVLAARASLPVARVSSEPEARLIARLLGEVDLGATVIADDDLALARHARRVRALRFADDALVLHPTWGEPVEIAREDLAVAVEGRVVSQRVDLIEGAGRGRGALELVDASHYFLESSLVDVYGTSLDESFRIRADAFDYGCLGRRPSPRLDENFAALGRELTAFVGRSRYDAAYGSVARLLDHAWPPASRVAARGLARRGDFKKYTASSVTTDPLAQFTRYSRMRFLLARG